MIVVLVSGVCIDVLFVGLVVCSLVGFVSSVEKILSMDVVLGVGFCLQMGLRFVRGVAVLFS